MSNVLTLWEYKSRREKLGLYPLKEDQRDRPFPSRLYAAEAA
jgi:hypothetical protein